MSKRLLLCILACSCAFGAEFFTGQGARLIVGQSTFTEQSEDSNRRVLGAPGGVAVANNMLFVADSNRVSATPNNHRVLIYRNLSSFVPGLRDELPQGRRCPVCVGEADVQLGNSNFKAVNGPSSSNLRLPTGVASDGRILVVADTDNNRVLIWNQIPSQDSVPANVVLGQADFTTNTVNFGTGDPRVPNASSMKGPQGVWIQDGRLFVADTGNNRVLSWNQVPTANNTPANLVIGQSAFDRAVVSSLLDPGLAAKVDNLLNPVSVSSDGTRLFVADLGQNRVMVWNRIPTQNGAPADIALGQPDMESGFANHVTKLCQPIPKQNENDPDFFPAMCAATLSFPRAVLAAGGRLFVADGGNDRILVWNKIPTNSGQRADVILGQISEFINENSDSANPLGRSSANTVRTPMGLAWDGNNLFVADPFNRRVVVFTPADERLLPTAARNSASREVYAIGAVTLTGNIQKDDEIKITIQGVDYTYKVKETDDLEKVATQVVQVINGGQGDRFVFASLVRGLPIVLLTAREPGAVGDEITLAATVSGGAQISASASGGTLRGGGEATQVAPGTILSVVGDNLSPVTEAANLNAETLPTRLGRTRAYIDGIAAPLFYASPRQVNVQLPWELKNATAGNLYLRFEDANGNVRVTNPVSLPVVQFNPGIYAREGVDPRPAIALHFSSSATGTVSVDGSIKAGERAVVKIGPEDAEREYVYQVKEGDTLVTVRDALVQLINEQDPQVDAFASGLFTRIRLRARVPGPAGNGIRFTATSTTSAGAEGASLIMTPTNTALCCANEAGALVTENNPALPGETVVVLATGLGEVEPEAANNALVTGKKYDGPAINTPKEFVSSLIGGRTANVLFAGVQKGSHDLYEVHLEINTGVETNLDSQLTIAQGFFVSNIVRIPVVNPESPDQGRITSSPGGGRGNAQVFTVRYTRREGGPQIGAFGILFNNQFEIKDSCFATFDVNSRQVRLWNSQSNAFTDPLPAGGDAKLESNQCTLNALNSKLTRPSEDVVEVTFDLTFKSAFAGSKSFFVNGWDQSGNELGWTSLGVWTVP